MTVSLQPVTRENVRVVCDLELAERQHHLVAPAAYTVAEGNYEPDAVLRAICLGGRPVGVALVEVETGTRYLVRFMVDAATSARRHRPPRRRAAGRRAARRGLALARDELRARHGR